LEVAKHNPLFTVYGSLFTTLSEAPDMKTRTLLLLFLLLSLLLHAITAGTFGLPAYLQSKRQRQLDEQRQRDGARGDGQRAYSPTSLWILIMIISLVTVVGLSLADILSGAYFVETLLGIPGIGSFTFESVRSRDYDVILATTLIVGMFFIVMNLITDLAYARIDPRIRLGTGART
ncbi:MAG: ABC transporter permease, partial [Deltaproteobacteria bacterium]